MEIFTWIEVAGLNRRGGGGFWFIFAAAAGFSAVVLAVALCARQAVRRGVCDSAAEGGGHGDSSAGGETARHWPGWGVLSMVKKGGSVRGGASGCGGGGGVALGGPQRLYTLIRNNSDCMHGIRTGDAGVAKNSEGKKHTVIQVGGAPVWQRRILMGERCRLPQFSGLILYDEDGKPVPQHPSRLQKLMN